MVATGGAVLTCLKLTIPQHRTNRQTMDLYQSEIYSRYQSISLWPVSHGGELFHFFPKSCTQFLHSLHDIEAMEKIKAIENQITACALFPIICVRKPHTISIHSMLRIITCTQFFFRFLFSPINFFIAPEYLFMSL